MTEEERPKGQECFLEGKNVMSLIYIDYYWINNDRDTVY